MNPTIKAKELLSKYYISDPSELDIRGIANAENLLICEEELSSHDGRIFHDGETGIITINKNIKEEGRKNFTLAHEIGHFFLECEKKYFCKKEDFLTFSNNKSNEKEANIFASELLMPEEWIKEYVDWKDEGYETLNKASDKFNTTLSSMAIRYAECGKFPIAVILSCEGKVKWSKANEYFPFRYVPAGQILNTFSNAFDFFKGKEILTKPEEILADAWFLNDFNFKANYYMHEQNIPMKNYNSVLTILWEA